jgi:UrcA family protein
MKSALRYALAFAVAVALATPAFSVTPRSARISTHGVNLASAQGQRLISLRIGRAADQLCDRAGENLDIRARRVGAACRADVRERALTQLKLRTAVDLASLRRAPPAPCRSASAAPSCVPGRCRERHQVG